MVQCCRNAAYLAIITPLDNSNPVGYFLATVKDLFEYALQDVSDRLVVGITIQNQVHQNNKPLGISFRRKYQLSGEVIWSVVESLPV